MAQQMHFVQLGVAKAALPVQLEPTLTKMEFACQLALNAKLGIQLMENALPATLDTHFLQVEAATHHQFQLHQMQDAHFGAQTLKSALNALKDSISIAITSVQLFLIFVLPGTNRLDFV